MLEAIFLLLSGDKVGGHALNYSFPFLKGIASKENDKKIIIMVLKLRYIDVTRNRM